MITILSVEHYEEIRKAWFDINTPIEELMRISNISNFDVNQTRFIPEKPKNPMGGTALSNAAYHGNLGLVNFFLSLPSINVNKSDNWSVTALHVAKKPEIVQALINAGADVNAVASSGCTPIMMFKNEYPETMLLLINAGARLNHSFKNRKVFDDLSEEAKEYINKNVFAPIKRLEAWFDCNTSIDKLRAIADTPGFDVNAINVDKNNKKYNKHCTRSSLLFYAAHKNDLERVNFLLSFPEIDVNCKGFNDMTPIQVCKNQEIINALERHIAI